MFSYVEILIDKLFNTETINIKSKTDDSENHIWNLFICYLGLLMFIVYLFFKK